MATTFSLRRKLARLVVGIYLASAVWVLIAFLRAPPDGLANIWTVVWTAPISFAGVYLERWTGVGFPFMPTRYFGCYSPSGTRRGRWQSLSPAVAFPTLSG